LTAPPVADAARRLDLELAQPASVNDPDTLAAIEQSAARGGAPRDGAAQGGAAQDGSAKDRSARKGTTWRDDVAAEDGVVVVVCAFGALIKEPLLSAYPMLNVHPSLLPRWRGAAPIERAIMAGDEQTGVSIMQLTAGLDSGPVCRMARERIAPQDTYGSLASRLAALGGQLLGDVLDDWESGAPPAFAAQDETRATYAEKIDAEDRVLDPAHPARELERVVRALNPHVGARIALDDGATLGVQRARALSADANGTNLDTVRAGTLAAVDGRLLFGTAEEPLELLEVQPAGKRPMEAASYLRGHALPGA
jgi:methionyl-tRNA formyltransferase